MGECKILVDKCSHLQNWSKLKIPMNRMPIVKSELFYSLSTVLSLLITYEYSSHYKPTIIKKTPTKTPMKGSFYGHSAYSPYINGIERKKLSVCITNSSLTHFDPNEPNGMSFYVCLFVVIKSNLF